MLSSFISKLTFQSPYDRGSACSAVAADMPALANAVLPCQKCITRDSADNSHSFGAQDGVMTLDVAFAFAKRTHRMQLLLARIRGCGFICGDKVESGEDIQMITTTVTRGDLVVSINDRLASVIVFASLDTAKPPYVGVEDALDADCFARKRASEWHCGSSALIAVGCGFATTNITRCPQWQCGA